MRCYKFDIYVHNTQSVLTSAFLIQLPTLCTCDLAKICGLWTSQSQESQEDDSDLSVFSTCSQHTRLTSYMDFSY